MDAEFWAILVLSWITGPPGSSPLGAAGVDLAPFITVVGGLLVATCVKAIQHMGRGPGEVER